MYTWMMRLKQNNKDMKQYFIDGKEEIMKRNLSVLKTTSFGMAFFIVFFLVITPVFLPLWEPTIYHILLLITTVIFGIIAEFFQRYFQKHVINLEIRGIVGIFSFAVMLLFIFLDTVAYPFAAQVFVAICLVIAPIIFIIPAVEMFLAQSVFLTIFMVLVTQYKEPAIASGDIFSAVLGYTVGIAAYFLVARIRMHDYNQKIAYKISSEIDGLTQIENRATCKKKIDAYLKQKEDDRACAMIVLDVDCFKQINDKLGHEKGDEVLYSVAQKLKQAFRSDDIIGRFGGDEFIVFMKDMKDDSVLEEKCNCFNQQITDLLDGKFGITCSMGVCYLDNGTSALETMFHVADSALYEAKTFHKGNYVIHELDREQTMREQMPMMVIVDDNRVDRETLAVQFEENYQITKFSGGAEALEFMKENAKEVSIVLLDMVMPDMGGDEVLRSMKKNQNTAWIPVVAVSADEQMEEAALECGADDMITKPIVPAVVKLRVDRVLKNR